MLLLSIMVGLLSNCVCGKSNTIEHALICPNVAFQTIQYNHIWDLTAELMSEVCHSVSKEPSLQPLSGESLSLHTCNQDDGAQLDIKASGFWGCQFQFSFFDIQIFTNPYRQHEGLKQWVYEERVRENEHASFSSLVFSTSGGMGASTAVTYKRLAFLLSLKWKTPYCRVMSWLRCRLDFSLLYSAFMCIRGSSSSSGRSLDSHIPASIKLALEGWYVGKGSPPSPGK